MKNFFILFLVVIVVAIYLHQRETEAYIKVISRDCSRILYHLQQQEINPVSTLNNDGNLPMLIYRNKIYTLVEENKTK